MSVPTLHTALPGAETLSRRLTGTLLLPGEPDWPAASTPWNVSITARPRAVVLAADAADVQAAVSHAAAHGLRVAVHGPGHGASAALDGTLLIRTTALRELQVLPERRVAVVGAGVTWGELQAALDGTGLTGLVGSSPSVSVVGLLLQGGSSWLTRSYGAAAGSLRSAEVVWADGSSGRVDAGTDAEALWALRGGGGRFAVVTSVEIDLVPTGDLAGGRLMFPVDAATAVLAAFRAATSTVDPRTSLWLSVLHFPPLPELPEPLRGRSFVTVDAVTTAGLQALERVLEPVRASGPVVHDTVRARTAAQLTEICEEPVEPTPAVQRGIPLAGLGDDAATAFLRVATAPGPFVMLQLRHLAGAPSSDLGIGTRVDAEYLVNALAIAAGPEAEEAGRQAADGLAATLSPWTGGSLPASLVAPWRSLADAYPRDQIDRLATLTRRLDPAQRFVAALQA